MWAAEGRFTTSLPVERLWEIWTDVDGWHRWADDIVWARLREPFAAGARGRIRYRGFPPMTFRVKSVEPGRAYLTEVPLALATLSFDHRIEDRPEDGGVELVERIGFRGPLAGPLGRLQGPRIERAWPGAMERLVQLAAGSG